MLYILRIKAYTYNIFPENYTKVLKEEKQENDVMLEQ